MPPTTEGQLNLLLIPAEWTELLLRIRAVCPTAVLAGGALRDLDNGREVKDLDVFIGEGTMDGALRAIRALQEAGFEVVYDETFEGGKVYPEDQNLEVVLVAEMEGFDLPVQLIFTGWRTEIIVDRFDYGVCRLSWDGKELVRPPEYDEDKAAQVFRLRRDRPSPASLRGSVRRYARLVEKYPGWDWQAAATQSGWGSFDFEPLDNVFGELR